MRKIYIYKLICPKSDEIRYIGKTKSIKRRLQSHIDYARNKNRKPRYVSDWVLNLLKQNLKPIIKIIEETDDINWVKKEKYWIKYHRELNCKLCNLTDGGESNDGYVYSEELKEIRRQARLGYKTPLEVKEKIRKSLSKKVICVEDNIILSSMKKAVEYSGMSKTTFHRKFHKGELINNKTYKYVKSQK